MIVDAIPTIKIDIEFLRKAYLELYEKVGDLTDCPVCFDTMVKDNTHLGILMV